MVSLVVSDSQLVASRLRAALVQHGHECPLSNVVSLDAASDALHSLHAEPDLVLIVMGDDHERARDVIRSLKTCQQGRIVAVGTRETELILSAVHAGADDYLDESANVHEELLAALHRMTGCAARQTSSGQVVTIVSGSGGSGRTTLATNLAVLAGKRHGRCGLLDLDLRSGNAATMLDLKPRHTIADLCRNLDKLDQNMFEQSLARHDAGVHLLPSPESLDEVSAVTVDGIARIVRLARAVFPCVVVDLNDFSHEGHRQLLQQSSDVILISRLDFASVQNAWRALTYLDRNGVDRRRIRFVINRSGQPHELPAKRVEQILGHGIFGHIPDDPKAINLSINCGSPCVLEAPTSSFAAALVALVSRIDEAHEGPAIPAAQAAPAAKPAPQNPRFPRGGWLWSRLLPSTQ